MSDIINAVKQTTKPFLTKENLWLQKLLNNLKEEAQSRMLVGDENGVVVPRYNLLSIVAEHTPMYVFDNPDLKSHFATAFTDGFHVFFNADFLELLYRTYEGKVGNKKPGEDALFVVLHELYHMVQEHVGRKTFEGHEHDLVNMATDLYINTNLVQLFQEHKKEMGDTIKSIGIGLSEDDQQYVDLSEETILRMLEDKLEKMNQPDQQQESNSGQGQPGSDGGASGQSGAPEDEKGNGQESKNGDPSQTNEANNDENPNNENSKDQKDPSDMSPEEKIKKLEKDYNIEPDAAPSNIDKALTNYNQQKKMKEQLGKAMDAMFSPHTTSPEEVRDLLNKIDPNLAKKLNIDSPEKIEAAKHRIENEMGDSVNQIKDIHRRLGDHMPGKAIYEGVAQTITDLHKPKQDWKLEVKKMIFGQGRKFSSTYEEPHQLNHVSPSSMGLSDGLMLPGMLRSKNKAVLAVLVDTSASVDDKMLNDFFSEIIGMTKNRNTDACDVVIVSADTHIQGEIITINKSNVSKVIKDLKAYGRTGTALRECINETLSHPKLKKKEIAGLIYFTDGGDAVPKRSELPKKLPPVTYMLPEGDAPMAERFRKECSDYAQAFEISNNKAIQIDHHVEQEGMSL